VSTEAALLTVTIDGHDLRVPPGTLIIRAAEQAGIRIPRFCDHPLLTPVGACRQCLVEVACPCPDGSLRPMPKPQPACAVPVVDGMVVSTGLTSPTIKHAAEGVLEFLLLNHPLDCPICDKSGECLLQDQAMSAGRAATRCTAPKRTYPKPIALTSQILLDRERCILCQRCTRFAAQIPGDPFLTLHERGQSQQVGRHDPNAHDDVPHPSADDLARDGQAFASYFAGNTVQLCPVGALTSSSYRFRARPVDLTSVPSVAEHDANGSAIQIETRRGQVLRRLAGDDPQVNREWLTDKDRFGFSWQQAPDRLTVPLIRRDGQLREASWPEAITAATKGLFEANGVGVLPGGRLTVEDALAYSLFARVALRTDDIDYRSRPRSQEEAEFLARHVAGSGLGVTFEDLGNAPTIILAGFEPEDEGGVVFLRLREAVANGSRIIMIAPFASPGAEKLSAQLIPTIPGAEAEVLDQLETLTGADLSKAILIVGERLSLSPASHPAALRAAGRTGLGLAWIPRRAGERAALEAGLLPGLLPAGRTREDAEEIAEALTSDLTLPALPGKDLAQILESAATGEIGALLVGGVELADLPEAELARAALSRAFTVCLEVRASEATALADVILPVAPPSEKAGTFINWEGRMRPFPQALPTMALSDARVLSLLALQLGCDLDLTPAAAHRLLARLGKPTTSDTSQTTVAALAPGEPPIESPPTSLPIAARGEAHLATWRELIDCSRGVDQEHRLNADARAAIVRLSPATAEEIGVGEGDEVTVSTTRGEITLPVRLTEMAERVVWLPRNSPGSQVLPTLGKVQGIVRIQASGKEAAS